ncbi:unnamed protein product [Sphenostylis stenocarpa]|uniref:Transcription factor CBF/NF-Y/archaeal histone domain-containing protein n=1 Tax=Sphenostylis stenocarpa TaxID=92480 RepID=A0AA86SYS1_9FABA|nr:unnamed protein product [Sphenostylis stenocarpa]
MKAHPNTKNGYWLKKLSMETRTYSILILPLSASTSIVISVRHGNRVKMLKAVNEKKGFANALGERVRIAESGGSMGFQGEWIRREMESMGGRFCRDTRSTVGDALGGRVGEVDVNALLGCPNAREGMTEELAVSLSLVLIHRIEKQHHHHTTPHLVFINTGLTASAMMEPMDIVGKAKEDASLPKATMTKIIKEMLPPDVRVARDAQDLLIECCVEFINLVSSESNEVCNKEERRTIAPEHVLKALGVLGFGDYIEEVYAAYEQHKLETMQDSLKGAKWSSNRAEMTEEEALAEQQRMFAEARARMNGGAITSKQPDADQSLES